MEKSIIGQYFKPLSEISHHMMGTDVVMDVVMENPIDNVI
jgi:hypothetical protein